MGVSCCLLVQHADTSRTHLWYARRIACTHGVSRRIHRRACRARRVGKRLQIRQFRCLNWRDGDPLPRREVVTVAESHACSHVIGASKMPTVGARGRPRRAPLAGLLSRAAAINVTHWPAVTRLSSTGAPSSFPGARRASGLGMARLLRRPSLCPARHSRRSPRRRPSACKRARTSRR